MLEQMVADLLLAAYLDWVTHKAVRNIYNLVRHGCRKKQRLPACRCLRNDFAYVVNESHVQHAICFVKNKYFYVIQSQGAPLHVVKHPSRGADNNVCVAQLLYLRLERNTTKDCCYPQSLMSREFLHLGAHLIHELACRPDDC